MIELILNDRIIRSDRPAAITLLDFIRYENHLYGTKIGCREGDCGACTVLIGSLVDEGLRYESITSCIAPLGNAVGKHVVTIEGLNLQELSPIQSALVAEGGTQCGFCTPGFVVSLVGYCLSCDQPDERGAIASIDGNICRCTGYKSIERSVARIVRDLKESTPKRIEWLVANNFIPAWFLEIPDKLAYLKRPDQPAKGGGVIVVVGTDLYVQRPDEISDRPITLFADRKDLKSIQVKGNICQVGAAATTTDLLESVEMNAIFPNLEKHLKLVSSTQIRNMGSLGGNFVNASPIGDLTIFFLALNSSLVLRNEQGERRTLLLNEFYLSYKSLALEAGEYVECVQFQRPGKSSHFNFEKVSKRTHLDIASVNSAALVTVEQGRIAAIHLAAGGIGPVPTYLRETCVYLTGKPLTPATIGSAIETMRGEISPISDARGSAEYKTLLLRQLFLVHFLELFPDRFSLCELV